MGQVDAFLKQSPLFKEFTDTGIQILAGIAVPRVFPKGTPLFVENMQGESLFVIGEGKVRLTAKREGATDDVDLGDLSAGDSLGELALVQTSTRLCTATALTDVKAIELRRDAFQKLQAQKPQACVKLLMAIVCRFGDRVKENREAFRRLIPKPGASPQRSET
jgi:CRP-like cAMP-binding protein